LAKSPGERYASASALANDLEHWLAAQPTIAKPERRLGRVRRVLAQHRSKVAVVLTVAATMALILAASGLPFGPSSKKAEVDPQGESRRDAQPIELVAERGGPSLPSRWLTGGKGHLDSLSQDGAFTVESMDRALFELMPNLAYDHFSLEADIRQNEGNSAESNVGIYFAQARFRSQADLGHSFSYVFIQRCDGSSSPLSQCRFRGQCIEPVSASDLRFGHGRAGQGMAPIAYFLPACRNGPAAVWRTIKIQLTGEALTVWWDGAPMQRVSKDAIQKYTLPADPRFESSKLQFEPRGGVGVYVHNAAASVRNVRLTPILDE
jgi:hypothetical protein